MRGDLSERDALARIRREGFTESRDGAFWHVTKDKPPHGQVTGRGYSWAEALHHWDNHPRFVPY